MRPTDGVLNPERVARSMVVIGASAGGVAALTRLFATCRTDLRAVLAAVLHRSPLHDGGILPKVLGRHARVPVMEPAQGEVFEAGRVYVAPRDLHLLVADGRFRLHRGPREHFTRPAVDPLFRSAAAALGDKVLGVLLTGGGDDGVAGLKAIWAAGGIAIVQDPSEAPNPSMPTRALVEDHVNAILGLERIAEAIDRLAAGEVLELREGEAGPASRVLRRAPA